MKAFQKQNFKLLVDPIVQDFLFRTRRKQTEESVCDKELTSRKAESIQLSDGIFWSMYFNQK